MAQDPRPPSTDPSLPVLVADDDRSVRLLFTTVLEDSGFETVQATNGREALEAVAARKVAAVLLDSRMPEMDGVEVIQALRARPSTRTLPVIIVTGEGDVDHRIKALEAGADDYLTKPVHMRELVARVRAQLRGQAEWIRLLEARMRERTEVVNALARHRPGRTPEVTADVICRHLAALPELTGVAVLTFAAEGSVLPLAVHGQFNPHVRVGRPLPPALARRLYDGAMAGPWTEHSDDLPMGGATARLQPLSSSGETTHAPLRVRDQLLGVLAVTTRGGRQDARGRSLALAIDVAAVAGALLAPTMEHWEDDAVLRTGIERLVNERAFRSVFQPIVELNGLAVVGYEALTRFDDGASPELRFAEATQVGLGVSLETAAISEALRSAGTLPPDRSLSLNVSPRLLTTSGELSSLIDEHNRPVVLELTEHDRIDDYPTVRAALDELGPDVRLSVDDAGSGYACLTHVLALRPTYVKLDRGWVHGIESDPARQALVAGLRHFATDTRCRLVAEGIETEDELDVLRNLHIELGQGYLLGRPEPAPAG